MLKCPIEYIRDNLIFAADKSCWAVYELRGFDYDMLSTESKIGILNRLTLFISGVVAEAKFMVIPVMQDLETMFKKLSEGLDENDPLYDYALNYALSSKNYLIESAGDNKSKIPANDYKTFVSVKLQKGSGDTEMLKKAKDFFDFFVKAVTNDINALAGTDTHDISAVKVNDYIKLAEQVQKEQTRRIELEAADSCTVWWLLQRNMYRGLPVDAHFFAKRNDSIKKQYFEEIELVGEKFVRPRIREVSNIFSGAINKSKRSLSIVHEKETAYQTFLVITSIPEEMTFPNSEWIYYLQQMNQQAEIYIHIKNDEHGIAIREIDKKRKEANSQIDNIDKANSEIPDDLFRSKEEIDALEAELKESRFPLVNATVTICVTADNQETLDEKAAFIRKEYEDLNFTVERPLADQYELFTHCLPCVTFTVKDYIMKLTPRALAGGIIGATRELGDFVGAYIGTTGLEKKNLFIDLRLACLSNTSASAVFYGNLGVGKSFNANLLIFLHVIYGGYGLIIDPKGERTHWIEKMPVLSEKGLISLVTLGADAEYRGMLDPFNIFRHDIAEATDLAINLLAELFKLKPKDSEYTALLDAIHRMKDELNPSMLKLVEILNNFDKKDQLYEAAKMLARQINLLQDSGMAQLMIGNGTEKAINLDNRLNILQVQNLKMPSPETKKEDYTQEEVISTVLMMVIAAFTRKFVHSHKNSFKIILFDESWMLGKTIEGEKLMSYVARMSRSLYASLILNGHSVTDLPNEGIRNSITYKFCFKTGNRDEARRMLDFLKLEKTPSNIDLLTSLGNAQCLFQDLHGRVGVLKFDAVFQDIIDIFSTTPVDKSKIKEEKVDDEDNNDIINDFDEETENVNIENETLNFDYV